MPSSGRAQAALLWGVLALLLLYAVAGLVVSLVPRGLMIERLGSMSGSGEAATQIAERYEALAARARITSALLLAGWAVLVWQRRRLAWTMERCVGYLAGGAAAAPGRVLSATRAALRTLPVECLVFLAILVAGVGLRLHYLTRDIRHDEAWTYVVYARRPVYLTPLVLTDVNHHPLNTLLIQASVALFGNPVWAIRLPAFLFGVGCIPAGYALGRALGGPGVAAIAAALIAGASAMIEYSVNARGYTGVAFFSLLLFWAGQSAVRTGATAHWGLAVLAAACGIYANIVMVLPGIAAFVWFMGLAVTQPAPWRNQAIRHVVFAGLGVVGATLFLYVPIFTVNGWDAIANSQGIKARAGTLEALATLPRFVAGVMEDWGRDFWGPLAWLGVALAVSAPVVARCNRVAYAALWLGIGAALMFQLGLVRDSGPDRVWLSFLPLLLILAAASLDGVLRGLGRAVPGCVALVLLSGMAFGVVRSATLLTSIETGYFPGARIVAERMLGMTAGDILATTRVRGDDIVYYALRRGLVLDTIQTKEPLRFYRARNAPVGHGPGTLILIIDKALDFCAVNDCPAVAVAVVPVSGPLQIIEDTPEWTELRAPKR